MASTATAAQPIINYTELTPFVLGCLRSRQYAGLGEQTLERLHQLAGNITALNTVLASGRSDLLYTATNQFLQTIQAARDDLHRYVTRGAAGTRLTVLGLFNELSAIALSALRVGTPSLLPPDCARQVPSTSLVVQIPGFHITHNHLRVTYTDPWLVIPPGEDGNYRFFCRQQDRMRNGYMHPHARNDGKICQGNGGTALMRAAESGRLHDIVDILTAIVHTYNPRSPYVAIDSSSIPEQQTVDMCQICGVVATTRRPYGVTMFLCESCSNNFSDASPLPGRTARRCVRCMHCHAAGANAVCNSTACRKATIPHVALRSYATHELAAAPVYSTAPSPAQMLMKEIVAMQLRINQGERLHVRPQQ